VLPAPHPCVTTANNSHLDPVRNPDDTIPEARSGQVLIANAERTRPARHVSARTQDAENPTNGRTSCCARDKGDTGYSSAAIKSIRSSGSSQRLDDVLSGAKVQLRATIVQLRRSPATNAPDYRFPISLPKSTSWESALFGDVAVCWQVPVYLCTVYANIDN
jgi:hypothetical protein